MCTSLTESQFQSHSSMTAIPQFRKLKSTWTWIITEIKPPTHDQGSGGQYKEVQDRLVVIGNPCVGGSVVGASQSGQRAGARNMAEPDMLATLTAVYARASASLMALPRAQALPSTLPPPPFLCPRRVTAACLPFRPFLMPSPPSCCTRCC